MKLIKHLLKLTDISEIKRISFRQDINGLRAIAVLAVVFYHAEIELFKGGWLGVDIFFVISGYLISNIIISELNEGTFSFKNFYLRRVRRILPALFSTLLLTIPFAYFLLTPKAMEEYISSMVSSIFFYANYHFMNLDFYIAESTKVMPLLHTWSLAIEEQYYLLFPLFTFLVYKYYKKYFTFFIVLITFGSIYINTLAVGSDKFYKIEYRIWELLFGVLVMILSSNIKIKHLEKIGLPLMLFPIFYFADNWINDTEPKLLALTGISLIIFSNSQNSYLSKILSFKPLTFIGLSSYSIYLLHQPIFAFYRVFIDNYNLLTIRKFDISFISLDIFNYEIIEFNNPSVLLTNVYLTTVLLLIGYLSYKNIELKLNNIKQLTIVFFVISSFVVIQEISTRTYLATEDSKSFVTEETVLSEYDCWRKLGSLEDSIDQLDNCIIYNNSDKYLLIAGDSSTIALHKSLLKSNQLSEYNYIFVSMDGFSNLFQPYNQNCEDCFYDWMRENKNNITTVVLFELHRWIEESGIYFQDDIRHTATDFISWIDILSKISNKVIVIEPFPTMQGSQMHPKDILYVSNNSLQEVYIPLTDWRINTPLTSNVFSTIKNSGNNIYILEITDVLCENDSNKCLVYKNPTLLYVDRTHLSTEGGSLIINKLAILINDLE